ncbi:MAG TPA: PH domain-containing protein [Nocardioidaceae bacterium]|jgi:putative membrane protein
MSESGPRVERPHRRLSPLTPLVRSFIFVVAVVATSWDDLLRGQLGPIGWILVFLLVAGAVYGTASWLRTKYWIEADELRVDTGLVSRQSRRIRIDRLQGVDIVQPFVARIFGLAELRMDVAGGSAREGSLAFLKLSEAHALRDLLLARRDEVRAAAAPPAPYGSLAPAPYGVPGAPGVPAADGVPATAVPAPEQVLARLDLGTLALSVLFSPETVGLLLTVSAFGALFLVFGEWLGLSAMLPVLLGLVLVQARRLANNYHFHVAQTRAGLQVRRGLFELSSQTIALHRVQGVVVTEPVMWRPFGWARLDVSVAGYATTGDDNDKPAASTVMPVAGRAEVMLLARHVLQGLDPAAVPLVPAPKRARWVAPVGWRFLAAGIGEHAVASRTGWLTRRLEVVPHARVQSLRLSQGPWQRRLGLADLHVDSPPGPVNVRARHRPASEVRALLEQEARLSRAARVSRTGAAPHPSP